MPDRSRLRVGDRIRIVGVPDGDGRQRGRELAAKFPYAGWTADTLERLVRSNQVVVIDVIDDFGQAWFDFKVPSADGSLEEHSIAVMDDESWELV